MKYLTALSIPLSAAVAFLGHGLWTFSAVVFAFGVIPLIELFVPADGRNLEQAEAAVALNDRAYSLLLYAMVPVQWSMLVWFLFAIQESSLTGVEQIGRMTAMGMLCGVIGINVGHELGHRTTRWEQRMAQALLLSSLYTHFFIEHNQGHHKYVATPEDPATARFREPLYLFWLRSMILSYTSAWGIAARTRRRKGISWWSISHDMWWFQVLQAALVLCIGAFAGWTALGWFIGAAVMGMLLLETVNYIEHYGLLRKKETSHRYENVRPVHSWNANQPLGRLVLFELTRHSDHHYLPHKPFQLLDSLEEAPQLPTGYPGMMLLSLVPPLWFAVMHPRIKALGQQPE